jgi:hypothetical protein
MDSQYFLDESDHVNNHSVLGSDKSVSGYKEQNESIFKLYIE